MQNCVGMEALRPYLDWFVSHTYLVVFVGTIIDATGLPFPGRVILVAAGALAAGGHVDLGLVIALGALGALMSDHLWYFAGWFGAQRLMALYCRLSWSSRQCVARTNEYFHRYGGATIIIGRFVAGVRVFAWPLARANGVGYPRFLACDAVGALLWSATWVLLGWVLGDQWQPALDHLGGALIVVPMVLLAGAAVALFVRARRRTRHGPAFL